MSNQPQHLYEFGPFQLDTEKRRVMRDGEIVSLTPKAFELLTVLVQRGGQVIEKDELMRQVWPETFVEEGNLSVHIFALRKALGENGDGQGYIETVPRQGYRFISSVRELKADGAALIVEKHTRSLVTIEEHEESAEEKKVAALPESQTVVRGALKRLRYTQVALVAALLLALAVGSLIYFQRNPKQPATGQLRTIAVLPFKPLSTGADDEYFRTGMADALIIKLGSLKQIVVRPTSAVLRYTDSKEDAQTIGRALGVDAVLEGYIQRDGERIRATARLLSVRDGAQLWAGSFDDSFTNVFAVQDSISAQVAKSLTLNLTASDSKLLAKRYTENSEAYRAFMMGRHFWNKRTDEGNQKAIEYYKQAIDLDPVYGLAYAGLADAYTLSSYYSGVSPREAFPKAKTAALRALEIDDALAEAYATLAYVKFIYDWNFQDAERDFLKAFELNPNMATARYWYGESLMYMGRYGEGIAQIQRAHQLDPLSIVFSSNLGWAYHIARQEDQAIEQLQKVLAADQNFPMAYFYLGMAYEGKGMYDDAIKAYQRAAELSGGYPGIAGLGHAYAISGRREEALKLISQMEEQLRQGQPIRPTSFAIIYSGLNDREKAFEWLEKAYQQRYEGVIYIKCQPYYDNLRSDPRYYDLVQRIGLTP